jgi:hypothetical protein
MLAEPRVDALLRLGLSFPSLFARRALKLELVALHFGELGALLVRQHRHALIDQFLLQLGSFVILAAAKRIHFLP